MSIASRARRSADTALEEGRSSFSATQHRVEALAGDTRARTRGAVVDTRSAAKGLVSLSRRHMYVQIGASDATLAVITKRSAELPAETRNLVQQLLESARGAVAKSGELVTQTQNKFTSTSLRNGLEQVKDAYLKLGDRGEQVATDLRHDPVVARMVGVVDGRVEKASNQLTSIAQKMRVRAAAQAERENAAATSTPVRPTAARQIPAHRTVVRNTPAGEVAVSATPVHRAAAQESEMRKAAAAKAAETRQARAVEREQATQARSDAAAKAAVTRKENAEQAAAKRQASAAKAAQTRRRNAQAEEQAAQTRSEGAAKAAATRKRNAERPTTG